MRGDIVPPVSDPYRDPARFVPVRCEICGTRCEFARCTGCLAVEELIPLLSIPVVVVDCNWSLGDPCAGAGFVLIDRWLKIARCACQFPFTSGRGVSATARARAELWAPGATIAVSKEEHRWAFAESLVRTRTADHPAVQHRFERAVDRAIESASYGREGLLGTRIWPESER